MTQVVYLPTTHNATFVHGSFDEPVDGPKPAPRDVPSRACPGIRESRWLPKSWRHRIEIFEEASQKKMEDNPGNIDIDIDRKYVFTILFLFHTMWGPLVISWFITPSNYGYNYHKP